MPSIGVCAPGSSAARYSISRERSIEDLVDERRLARSADAGDGDERAERKRDVDVLEVVRARAADDDLAARRPAGAPPARRSRRSPREVLAGQRLARRRRAAAAAAPGTSRGRRARPRPGRDRSDSRPCESSPRRARRRARCCRGCAACTSVASSRRLSRWCRPIDGSSSTYSTPVSCEPICVASRMRWPSPPESVAALRAERQIADADVDEEAQPLANLAQHAAGDEMLALGELERFEQRQRVGNRQVDVLGEPPALDAHRAALRPQPLAVARRTRLQRAVRLERFLIGPRALRRSGAAGSGITPSKSAPNGSLRRLRLRVCPFAWPRCRARRAARCRAASSAASRTAPADRCRTSAAAPRASRRCSRLSPFAHGATAPSASDCESSGTMRAGSKS